MLEELPDDVLLELVYKHISNPKLYLPWSQGCISSLALTSKRLREIVLPALYRTLQFGVYVPKSSDKEHILQYLSKGQERARYLQGSGHLLRHVQCFRLQHWSIHAIRLSNADPHSPSSYDTAHPVWLAAYNCVTNLVSSMPNLRSLEIYGSPITSRLHHAAYDNPSLESLTMRFSRPPQKMSWHVPLEPSIALHLRHFDYGSPDEAADGYVSHILENCILNLISLAITPKSLPKVYAHALNRLLALQNLIIQNSGTMESTFAKALTNILRATPHLRHLENRVQDWSIYERRDFTGASLPRLEYVKGSPALIRALIPGRTLHTIELSHPRKSYPITRLGEDIATYPAAHVRKLTLCGYGVDTLNELTTFLGALRRFPNLIHLEVDFKPNEISWEKWPEKDIEEIRGIVGDIAAKWPQLCVFHVKFIPPILDLPECPIATEHDPSARGHFSLERLMFLQRYHHVWVWVFEKG